MIDSDNESAALKASLPLLALVLRRQVSRGSETISLGMIGARLRPCCRASARRRTPAHLPDERNAASGWGGVCATLLTGGASGFTGALWT